MRDKKLTEKNKQKNISKTAVNTREIKTAIQNPFFYISIILLISLLLYIRVFWYGFINWDDDMYILNNPIVKSISLKNIFSGYILGNYHPITILVYAIEFYFFELNASGYHVINVLLHLLNTFLVFTVFKHISGNNIIALITSLLFGIHPVHVESVAWIAELKDVLYTFFFLLAYFSYLIYKKARKKIYYLLSFIFFSFSILSKAMAVSFPLILILTDYYLVNKNLINEKNITFRNILEKVPFFLLALIFGFIAIEAQKTIGAADVLPFSLGQRLVFATYSYVMYLIKLILPLGLSAYYAYPSFNGNIIPTYYYSYVFIFIVLLVLIFLSLKKNKIIFFSMLFFTLNILFVLQIKSVGGAIMADRYNYVASIGIFYLISSGVYYILSKSSIKKIKRTIFISFFSGIIIFYSYLTFTRIALWENSIVFWNDVITKNDNIPIAYQNRGMAYMQARKYDEALRDMNKAVRLSPGFATAYYNKALVHMYLEQYNESISSFNKAVSINPIFKNQEKTFTIAYYNRGTIFLNQNKMDAAYSDFCKVITLDSNYTEAYVNRGNILRDRQLSSEALADYDKAIQLNPLFSKSYFNRGNLFLGQKKFGEAIADYDKAIELTPDYAKAFYNKGNAEYFLGKRQLACKSWQKASLLGFNEAEAQYKKACN